MKRIALVLINLIFIASGAAASKDEQLIFRSIEQVFGPVPSVTEVLPRRARQPTSNATRGSMRGFNKQHLKDKCNFPLEVLIVQDASYSFKDDFEEMASTQIPAMKTDLDKTHPGSTFALVSFTDKPIAPFGKKADYCASFEVAPLTDDTEELVHFYETKIPFGDADDKYGNNFGALFAASQSGQIGWSNDLAVRLVVQVTDKLPHFHGDADNTKFGLSSPSGLYDEAKDDLCTKEYYNTPAQVAKSIEARGAYLAHLISSPDYLSGEVGKSWVWFNRFAGQTDDFVNLISADSSDFWKKLSSIIQKIEQVECHSASTPLRELQESVSAEPAMSPTKPPMPSTKPCSTRTILKNGIYVNLGYEPKTLIVNDQNGSILRR